MLIDDVDNEGFYHAPLFPSSKRTRIRVMSAYNNSILLQFFFGKGHNLFTDIAGKALGKHEK